MMKIDRRLGWISAALAVVIGAGCGNLTPGGFTGVATVRVSGDADTLAAVALAPAFATAVGSGPAAVAPLQSDGPSASPEEAEGQLQVKFLAYLVNESGGRVQLGDEELQVQVDLKGRTEADAVDRQLIPAVVYTDLRLVFLEIKAEVEGLVIDGTPVPEVHVELRDVSLEVSRPIVLDVQPGSSAELVIDLNALAWLGAVDPITGAVDESVFADLVNVVVE